MAEHLRNDSDALPNASILIVDRETRLAADLAGRVRAARSVGARFDVLSEVDFTKARTLLRTRKPSLLVTALQLGEYNGLHLVHLANVARPSPRSVVHTESIEPVYAREVQEAGAFYEVRSRLMLALPAYVDAALPPEDRRNPIRFDRRRLARGGRRAADSRPSL